ncbi:hypothetical protein ABZP36_023645 [Zizania latifolia]
MSVACAAALPTASARRRGSPQVAVDGGKFVMMRRRDFVTKGVTLSVCCSLLSSSNGSAQALEMLPFKADGYNFWTWRDRRIHYVEQGAGQPIVLIHGFGASAFHWRYNIPELAKKYKVYAVDLLGFGWSEKALVDYEATVWMEQISDFLREVVKEPAVLVGNSLGGSTTLFTATEVPELVRGVVLINSAGQFGDPDRPPESPPAAPAAAEEEQPESAVTRLIVRPIKEAFQRVVLGFLFWQAKQPARVEKVLKSVSDMNCCDEWTISAVAPCACCDDRLLLDRSGVQGCYQRRRLPDRLHHGAGGGPQRRRGVLQDDVAVHGEPEPVHAGQAAGQAVVPAAAAVGGPGPVGRAGQGGADQGVLPGQHRRQPAGRPLPARRGAGAVQQGAARVARLPRGPQAGGGAGAHSPSRVIIDQEPKLEDNQCQDSKKKKDTMHYLI